MDSDRVPDAGWRWLVRTLQLFLAAAALGGAVGGRADLVVNGVAGLAFTLVPSLMERRWGVAVAPSLVAWLAVAASLHVAGMVFGLYGQPSRYDDLTHAVSGSVVAAAGFVLVAAWERLIDDLVVPPAFRGVVVLVVVVSGGVAWEVVEFAVSRGVQLGLVDTMSDLLYNIAGGVVPVALFRSYLDRVARDLVADVTGRDGERTGEPSR